MEIGDIQYKIGQKPDPNDTSVITACNRYLWYGDYGCGKTHLAGTAHELLRQYGYGGVYLMDFDKGLKTLFGREGCKDLTFHSFGVEDYHQVTPTINNIVAAGDKYSCVVLDSLTTMENAVMYRARKITGNDDYDKMPHRRDYGVLMGLLNRLLHVIMKLSHTHHVILTAHIREREDERTKIIELLPGVTGKRLPSNIGLWFNEVWHMSMQLEGKEKVQRALTITEHPYKCKTQTMGMPIEPRSEHALKLSLGIPLNNDNDNNDSEEAETNGESPS